MTSTRGPERGTAEPLDARARAGLWRALPRPARARLRLAFDVARARGVAIFLVGGPVRDLLLGREVRDLDLLVERGAEEVARALAARVPASRVVVHGRFGTASVRFGTGDHLDLVAARRERYPEPGRLPVVSPGTVDDDLRRRDFTINALALRLGARGFGAAVDPFGGVRDLRAGAIRFLHDRSFVDDPTRVFRAVRLSLRLDLGLERRTRRALIAAVEAGGPGRLSPARLGREVRRLLDEVPAALAVRALKRYGMLRSLRVTASSVPGLLRRARRLDGEYAWFERRAAGEVARWRPALALLAAGRPAAARRRLGERLAVDRGTARLLDLGVRRALRLARLLDGTGTGGPGRVHARCRPLSPDEVLLAAALCRLRSSRAALRHYLSESRRVRLAIGGRDVVRAGVPPGPAIAKGLEAALRARLEGDAPGRAEQLAVAVAAARRSRGRA